MALAAAGPTGCAGPGEEVGQAFAKLIPGVEVHQAVLA